jgi:hypothetical protein
MPLTLRNTKGSALTYTELDGNFTFLSSSISSSVASQAIVNNVNNRVVTATGTPAANGEANLTFDGTTLNIIGNLTNGSGNVTSGVGSHAEGLGSNASGNYSHAEGWATIARGYYSHVEGQLTQTGTANATVFNSLNAGTLSLAGSNVTSQFPVGCTIYLNDNYNGGAEDFGSIISTVTTSNFSAGNTTITISNIITSGEGITPVTCLNLSLIPTSWNGTDLLAGASSHTEGYSTRTVGDYSHAEGYTTVAIGQYSHAEGSNTNTFGAYSHAEGFNTIALGDYQHVQGLYNITSSVAGAFIHGNGSSAARKNLINAYNSTVEITGSLTVTGSATINNLLTLTTRTTTPAAGTFLTGSIIMSGSIAGGAAFLYVYTGAGAAAGWAKITAV